MLSSAVMPGGRSRSTACQSLLAMPAGAPYNADVTDRGQQRRKAGARCAGAGRALGAGLWLALAAPLAAAAPPPSAPTPESAAPDEAAVAANLLVSPAAAARRQRADCDDARSRGEIVVCGADHGEQWRVPSTADSDPASRQHGDTGVPRAPNVGSEPDCSIVKCMGFGRVPPPVYVVDFSKLPEAPAGSEADRIAKGEIPAP